MCYPSPCRVYGEPLFRRDGETLQVRCCRGRKLDRGCLTCFKQEPKEFQISRETPMVKQVIEALRGRGFLDSYEVAKEIYLFPYMLRNHSLVCLKKMVERGKLEQRTIQGRVRFRVKPKPLFVLSEFIEKLRNLFKPKKRRKPMRKGKIYPAFRGFHLTSDLDKRIKRYVKKKKISNASIAIRRLIEIGLEKEGF